MMRIQPDFETFEQRCRQGNLISVWTEILADMETPVSVFRKLGDGDHAFLLESVEQGDLLGRYSFIGFNPEVLIRSRGEEVAISYFGVDEQIVPQPVHPLAFMREFMQRYQPAPDPDLPPFIGGGVGYMAYDMVRCFEKLPNGNPDDLKLPDTYFMIADTLAIFDHVKRRMILLANAHVTGDARQAYDAAVHKIELMLERLHSRHVDKGSPLSMSEPDMDHEPGGMKSNFTKEEFEAGVEQAKEYIRAGDAFQIVLSQRFSKPYHGDPFDIYRALRAINPSPYMYYLKFGDLQLAGSSPEILVRVNKSEVTVRPIAGTRPRGGTFEEDRNLERELLADPKERAEHIMLVDLGRNDVGRVAAAGTVRVDDLMSIERYSHVMHIVSNVVGKLAPGKDAFDALEACFPAGTVSGAPKIRAMEIIDEIENVRRGPLCRLDRLLQFRRQSGHLHHDPHLPDQESPGLRAGGSGDRV